MGPREGNHEYKPELIPKHPQSNGLVVFRKSDNWHGLHRPRKDVYSVPLIDRSGLIHAYTLGVWRCNHFQLYSTIVSTVFKRLCSLNRKIRHKYRIEYGLLLKIAIHYAYTNDDSWFKRCVSMLFNKGTGLLSFVYKKFKQVDTNTRFLYDQVLKNTSWFQHRGPCRLRDKSTTDDNDVMRKNYVSPRVGIHSGNAKLIDDRQHEWGSVYRIDTRVDSTYLFMINSPRAGKSSCMFRGKPNDLQKQNF